MTVVEDLTEEEKYLWAIVSDESGLDLAEFTWIDEEHENDLPDDDGNIGVPTSPSSFCWRAWPYQWTWFRCTDTQQIDQCARSVGKSLSIKLRGFAFPFIHPGAEMVVTAPELNHLEPITDLIEYQFYSVRLGRMMLATGRSGVTHRPFKMNFKNGARIMGRIPQKDGKGVKGIHPVWLELDEAQDYPKPGWTELNETLKRGASGHVWRAHGVTRGVRDDFFDNTQPGSGWNVHKFTAMHRPPPFWSDEEREAKIKLYHGRDNGDYRRNILGEHGDSASPIFNLHRLMACVDDDTESKYNADEYVHYELIDSWLRQSGSTVLQELDLPIYHTSKYSTFWVGMDVGWCVTEDTEIFTQRGWLNGRDLKEGDQTLAIDPETGLSAWQSIDEVHRFDSRSRKMIDMEGKSFSSMSTPNHRWLVKSESGKWRWKTTETLNTKDCIPLTVGRSDLPTVRQYSDAFVELVAWFWTEGCVQQPYGQVSIGQSLTENPLYVKRIETALTAEYGTPGAVKRGPRSEEPGPLWSFHDRERSLEECYSEGTMRYFNLSAVISQALLETCEDPNEKTISVQFLSKLTSHQLELFIATSIDADGWLQGKSSRIEQGSLPRIKAFEAACALAGRSTSTNQQADGAWHLTILGSDFVRPMKAAGFPRVSDQAMTVEEVDYEGEIWCPVLKHHNWLARRNGSVYFTGNTNHPSEILIFAEERMSSEDYKYYKNHTDMGRRKAVPATPDIPRLKLVCRITLIRIAEPDQEIAIMHVINHYKPKAFSFDATGGGLPMFQNIQRQLEETPYLKTVVKGYNFSGNILVDFDKTIDVSEFLTKEEYIKEVGIKRNTVDYATDQLRLLIDSGRFWLPWDQELLNEFGGQTYKIRAFAGIAPLNQYGRREYSLGKFHALDGCRMMALGWAQYGIEEFVKNDQQEPIFDLLGVQF